MFIRLFIGLLLFAVAAFVLTKVINGLARHWPTNTKKDPEKIDNKLVKCAKCGTFLPIGQAVKYNDCYYCCNKHANNTD